MNGSALSRKPAASDSHTSRPCDFASIVSRLRRIASGPSRPSIFGRISAWRSPTRTAPTNWWS
jgi:hypothetical protein